MAHSIASNEFGIKVLNAITAANSGNIVISPLSLSTALGMIHLGAKGDTNNELRNLLGYNEHKITDDVAHNAYKNLFNQIRVANSRQYVLNVANRVMVQNDFNVLNDYRNQLQIYYDASIQSVDFVNDGQNAITTINDWVASKTSGKIQSLFSAPLPALTSLVIVNAVYFKGEWLNTFKPENTREGTFNNNGNTKVTVQMMFMRHGYYNFIANEILDADILEMPYIGGHNSMYIVLPHTVNGLQKTASALTEYKLISAIKSMSTDRFNLYLPKFKMEMSYKLVRELKSLGLTNTFTNKADFSGINGRRILKVSDVVHKVFLEVNELGTEAAAATYDELECFGRAPPSREFKVDHPFIFVIRDKRNDVNLFYGQITQL